ncbi:MAG TPA: NAD(P)H-binding protein [Cyclobacteriaceae bacterium]|nr:NAD(P)H-binding protein [Cyclobacteriaceae bacterium]
MKTALIAGSTGLIGKQLLQLLLEDQYYGKVIAITRKPLVVQHAKLENLVLDYDKLAEHDAELKADDVFCCLGTTIKIAKTKEAFRKVDFEYPHVLARITKNQGATQYLLISALGADKKSGIFYNKVKGDVEDAISAIAFRTVHIFRPSLLLGDRTEQRAGEGAATTFFKALGFLIPAKYKAIDSAKVARAMLSFAKTNDPGFFFHESKELQTY